ALLKRDHGIEVKSASSTIEEVVARQFVDRLAKQRRITLPTGDIFAETPAPKGKKPLPGKKAPEPQKPAAPMLPPPRLVKTAKPAVAAAVETEPVVEEEAPPAPPIEIPPPAMPEPVVVEAAAIEVEQPLPAPPVEAPPPPEPEPVVPVAAAPVEPAPAPKVSVPGRVVPPMIRLRIEE